MTTKPVLSLGIILGLFPLGTGCQISLILPEKPSAKTALTRIPDQLESGDKSENSPAQDKDNDDSKSETGGETAKAEIERPYMSPPIIPGADDPKPLVSSKTDTVPESSNNEPNKPTPKPETPQISDTTILLTQREGGLYYAPLADEAFTGTAKLLREDDTLFFEGAFKNGQREGKGIEWDKEGHIKYEGLWRANHIFTGKVFFYYPGTDTVKLQGEYREGRLAIGEHLDRTGQKY